MKLGGWSWLALAACLGACAGEEDVGSTRQPIIGALSDDADVAVVSISFPRWAGATQLRNCTGVVIGTRTVLTAATCLYDAIYGNPDPAAASSDPFIGQGRVYLGTDQSNPDRVINVADARVHHLFQRGIFGKYDIGVLLLAEDAGVTPVTLNDATVDGVIVPQDPTSDHVRSVGYGDGMRNEATGMTSGAGVRRSAQLIVQGVAPRHLLIGDLDFELCKGDMGWPDYFDLGSGETVVAIHAGFNDAIFNCVPGAVTMRVDAFLDDFIIPALDAWEGACAFDGTCVTTGCRTVDPDCDPCGANGMCGADCPQPDWDCPAGGVVGDPCTNDQDCETRRCLPALDDPRILYCSDTCSAASMALDCGDLACQDVNGEQLCVYEAPTPGAQGAACLAGADCRSGLCDPEFHICVEECDPAAADACPTGYECSPSSLADHVCRPMSDGGGGCACAAAGRGSLGGGQAAGGLLLLGACLLLTRPRRSRRAR